MNEIKRNIIYFLPALKRPSGGAKYMYHHSNLINKMSIKGFSSSIIHYKKKKISKILHSLRWKYFNYDTDKNYGYKPSEVEVVKNFKPSKEWMTSDIKHKNDINFNPKKDFIIFPEIISHFAKKFCIKQNIKYSIFVLGAYHMNSTNNFKDLNEVYKKSCFLMDISNNSRKCLNSILPNYKKKFFRVNLSINANNFKSKKIKQNLITCMPRKLKDDFHLLKFFINQMIPKNWKLITLTNMTNKEISNKLASSKIFLSFSSFEGLGLPPIEAAFSGNKVIGYAGEGGNDYFNKPIFEKISKGNILDFSKKIQKNIKSFNKKWNLQKDVLKSRKKLIKKYSLKNEENSIRKILFHISSLYKPTN